MVLRKKPQKQIRGIAVSQGIAIGRAFVLHAQHRTIEQHTLAEPLIEKEVVRFQKAVQSAKTKLKSFRRRVSREVGESEALIFDSHLSILEDPMIIDETIRGIREKRVNAEFMLHQAVTGIADKLKRLDDEYIRERATDIEDVSKRVLNHLLNQEEDQLQHLEQPAIIVAQEITPSDTANMTAERVLGFATDKGGPTSHSAIMANALEIPAVLGCEELMRHVEHGDQIIIDGLNGEVIVRPNLKTIAHYQQSLINYRSFIQNLTQRESLPCETLDGYEVQLAANIELPDEINHIFSHGADRIGLFRTEFLYLRKIDAMPNEDEQFEVYRTVAAAVQPNPVVIRTLDLGGDKIASALPNEREFNPYLGLRAIRLCLAYPEILRQQLRAMLRASVYGNIKIMIPMVTTLSEVLLARQIYADCCAELKQHKIAFKSKIEIGVMIETPAAAISADQLAEHVDFFSIGTNDLIQYTLAVDRGNEKVAHLYEPYNPAVLRLLSHVINIAQRRGVPTSVCGEIAGDPLLALLLVGMGIDELSMSPVRIPLIKEVIRHVTLPDVKALAGEVLNMPTANEVRKHIHKRMSGLLPHNEWILAGTEKELV